MSPTLDRLRAVRVVAVIRAPDADGAIDTVDVVKLFPAALGGPAYVRALRGPFPDTPFMPTGGVSAGNLSDWLDAGVIGVGVGSEQCSAADIAGRRFDAIEAKARRFRVPA